MVPGNSTAPAVATGHQAVERDGIRTALASAGTMSVAGDDGQRKRTHASTRRQTNQARNAG